MSNVTVIKGEEPRKIAGQVVQKIKQQFEDQPWRGIGQSERIVSGIAAVGMASMAMHSRSFLRAILMIGGAAGMAHRAYTGRCGFSRVGSRLGTLVNEQMNQQSSGNRSHLDEVGEASEESFPASDSPSFTPVTGSAASTETSSSNSVGSSRSSGNHANTKSTSNS